jgi:hypothetical protein
LLQTKKVYLSFSRAGIPVIPALFLYLERAFFRALASPGGLVNVCLSFTVTKVVLFSVCANTWYYFLYSFNRYLLFKLKRKVYLHFLCFLVAFLHGEERHQRTPAYTSGHQRTPADTSVHQRTPAYTSGHQRTPADTSVHQRTPADTSVHQRTPADTSVHQARRAAKRRRTRPPPGHISPPDGVPGGHVPRSEARGFHRESGENPLFQFQTIRLLFSFEGNTKKGNRITSDCL